MTTTATTPRIVNGIDLDALSQTIDAIIEQPELGAATFRATSCWVDARRTTTTIDSFAAAGGEHRRPTAHELRTDLPEALMGTDQGLSPLEVALSALGSCVATTLVAHAAAKGIPLRAANVALCGDLDLRGFLNLADVRTGYQRLGLDVQLDTDLSEEERAKFVASALRFSPVLDLFRRGTQIAIALSTERSEES